MKGAEIKDNRKFLIKLLCIEFFLYYITPFLLSFTYNCYDGIYYGSMNTCFVNGVTIAAWFIEIDILHLYLESRYGYELISSKANRGKNLSDNKLLLLFVILIASVFIISAQIGFKVKPFYDFGTKFSGFELINKISVLVKNGSKCLWITIFVRELQKLFETKFKNKNIPYGGIALMFLMGIPDVFISDINLAVTYILIYIVFGVIYLVTDRSFGKSLLANLFIYIF